MTERDDRLARIARGWDEAAAGYEEYFVPRFAPWVEAAVRAVVAVPLPAGPILVPCCGTFPELDALVRHLPDRELVGIDLSAEMVAMARERAAGHPQVSVVEGDASTLDPRWTGACAAVVSVFGLQQLPEPAEAIRSWADVLRPGGRLSVVFWPEETEADGPFRLISDLVRERVGGSDRSWEDELVPALRGLTVERDELVSFPIHHPDGPGFFDRHAESGPLRALAIARGDEFMTELRADYRSQAPAGEWTHHPTARHLVASHQAMG